MAAITRTRKGVPPANGKLDKWQLIPLEDAQMRKAEDELVDRVYPHFIGSSRDKKVKIRLLRAMHRSAGILTGPNGACKAAATTTDTFWRHFIEDTWFAEAIEVIRFSYVEDAVNVVIQHVRAGSLVAATWYLRNRGFCKDRPEIRADSSFKRHRSVNADPIDVEEVKDAPAPPTDEAAALVLRALTADAKDGWKPESI